MVALSTAKLATIFGRKKMLAEGLGAMQMVMEIPHSTDPWHAIVAEDKTKLGLLQGLGRTGPRCVSNPHREIRGARIIWHRLSSKDRLDMLKAYKNCPHFAIMREEEFLGEDIESCDFVLQFCPKASVRQAACPYMWHAVHASLQEHLRADTFFSVQLASKAKICVGLQDNAAAQHWLVQAKFEAEVVGLNIKDERTNELVSHFVSASHTESNVSTISDQSR